ncbi:MAG: AAA family ATPase [Oscillospiraceae bacterium]|nr:AAA family ATPase [Oscillospiraceae bacterium]
MNFVFITGPQAVGKMTVGQALAARSGMRLFHNHMAIELAREILGRPLNWALVKELRTTVFRHVAQSDEVGMIYTGIWAFDEPDEHAYYNGMFALWRELRPDAQVYVVELQADFDERLRRNNTENRLLHKPSKRDLEWSEADVRAAHECHRMASEPGEITEPNYLRIDNTSLSPDDVAARICAYFDFVQAVGT